MNKLLINTISNFRDTVILTSLEEIKNSKEDIYPPCLFILHKNIKGDSDSDLSISINTGEEVNIKNLDNNNVKKILATIKVDSNPNGNTMYVMNFYDVDVPKKEIYIYNKDLKFEKSLGAYIKKKDIPFKNNNKYYADFRRNEK